MTDDRGAKLVVLSGPSGVGKSTLVASLRKDPRVFWSVSATTRPQRRGEVEGSDYCFLSVEQFEALRAAGGLLEHALVHGNYYGTPRGPIEQALAEGRLPLLDIDVQGAVQVMSHDLPAVYIFIQPPDMSALEERLANRNSDSPEVIERRIAQARHEMTYRDRYDHVVTNDDLARALAELQAILEREVGLKLGEFA